MVFSFPGGAAAEHSFCLPPGTTHLFEHLFYRQNELNGRTLDSLGGKFGLVTDRSLSSAYISFGNEHASVASDLLIGWWNSPNLDPQILVQEKNVIRDEIKDASLSAYYALRRELSQRLAPDTWLAKDYVGTPSGIDMLTANDIRKLQSHLSRSAAVMVAVGSKSPWKVYNSTISEAWPPPLVAKPSSQLDVGCIPTAGHALVLGGRILSALDSKQLLSAIAAFSALEFGRIHPMQHVFHSSLQLRFLSASLELIGNQALLTVFARCPDSHASEVGGLVKLMLEDPYQGSSKARLVNVTQHYLGSTMDDARAWAFLEARLALACQDSICKLFSLSGQAPSPWLGDTLVGGPVALVIGRPQSS